MWQGGHSQALWLPNSNMNYSAQGPSVNNGDYSQDWAARAAMWAHQRQFQEQYNAQQQQAMAPPIPQHEINPPLPPDDYEKPVPPDNANSQLDHGRFMHEHHSQSMNSPSQSLSHKEREPHHFPHPHEPAAHVDKHEVDHISSDDHHSRSHQSATHSEEYHQASPGHTHHQDTHQDDHMSRHHHHHDNKQYHQHDNDMHHHHYHESHPATMDHNHRNQSFPHQPQFTNEMQNPAFGHFGPPVRPVMMEAQPTFHGSHVSMPANASPQMFDYNHSVDKPRPIVPLHPTMPHQYPFPAQAYGSPQMMLGEMDAMKKKMLPQWLREGLEKREKDKTKNDTKDLTSLPSASKISGYQHEPDISPTTSPKQSPEREDMLSDEEDGNVKDDDVIKRQSDADSSDSEDSMAEEEKEKILLLKVKWLITDLLMSVTASEIIFIAQEVCNQAKEKAAAKSKQLRSSGGLDALRMGFGEGSSSDNDEESEKEDAAAGETKPGRFFEAVANVGRVIQPEEIIDDRLTNPKYHKEEGHSKNKNVSSESDSEQISKKRSKSKHSSKRKGQSPSPSRRPKKSKRKSRGYDSSSSDVRRDKYRVDKHKRKHKSRKNYTSSSSSDSDDDESSTSSSENSNDSDEGSSSEEERYREHRHSKSKSKKHGRDRKENDRHHSEKRGKKHRKHKSKSSRSGSPRRKKR